jgi:hypothetical protein
MDTITGPRELGMLFRGCVLRVPPYQRAYAWSPDPPLQNLQDFLSDLRNHPADQDYRSSQPSSVSEWRRQSVGLSGLRRWAQARVGRAISCRGR